MRMVSKKASTQSRRGRWHTQPASRVLEHPGLGVDFSNLITTAHSALSRASLELWVSTVLAGNSRRRDWRWEAQQCVWITGIDGLKARRVLDGIAVTSGL